VHVDKGSLTYEEWFPAPGRTDNNHTQSHRLAPLASGARAACVPCDAPPGGEALLALRHPLLAAAGGSGFGGLLLSHASRASIYDSLCSLFGSSVFSIKTRSPPPQPMGDSAGVWTGFSLPGVRHGCAGLAGKPAPGTPPPLASDGSYVVVSPSTGNTRTSYLTPVGHLPALTGQGFHGAGSAPLSK